MSAAIPSGPYDPLAKLYKQREALRAAGSRGEAVADAIHEVNLAIGAIIEQREEQIQRERERYRR